MRGSRALLAYRAMESLENVCIVLTHRRRVDLANLLKRALVKFEESSTYGSYLSSVLTTAEVYAPIGDCDQLRALSDEDKDAILQALLEIHPPKSYGIEITSVMFDLATDTLTGDSGTVDEVIQEIEAQRSLMI